MNQVIRVLMVEDVEDDARLLAAELKRGGYDVTFERVDTAAALRAALQRQTWDVILCDFTMPYFSGEAALRLAQEAANDAPFIYVSGTIGEDVAVEAMKSGAQDYILKTSLQRLMPAVERELCEAQLRRDHKRLVAERERLVVELTAALADVKRLSGLLPICAGCKKIRADRNEWQPIEVYIRNHSEAQFSHGMCPECMTRLYGNLGREDQPAEVP